MFIVHSAGTNVQSVGEACQAAGVLKLLKKFEFVFFIIRVQKCLKRRDISF